MSGMCKLTWRGIGILTLMTVLVCPVAFAQQATPGEKAAAGRTIESDLSFITPGAFMATVSYPRRVLTSPESELLP
ncbi:MAG: hypothetical protein JW818_10150, partial [Pirellulales bacterium]|nr:hypothetical protein [Pirellulales bacterium]